MQTSKSLLITLIPIPFKFQRIMSQCIPQARDNMKLFLMAGSETTASSIPVLMYLLTTYPDVQVNFCSVITVVSVIVSFVQSLTTSLAHITVSEYIMPSTLTRFV